MKVNPQRLRLSAAWATLFVMGTDLFVASPLLPFIARDFLVQPAQAGLMVTVFSITYAIGSPIAGWLADRNGRDGLIIGGLFSFAVTELLTALSAAFHSLVLVRAVAGFAVASVTPVIYAIVCDIAPFERRASWLAITASGYLTALVVGAPAGAWLRQLLGWRSLYFILAMAVSCLAVLHYSICAASGWMPKRGPVVGMNTRSIICASTATVTWSMAMYALYVYLGTGLHSYLKLSSASIGRAFLSFGVGAISGNLTGGKLVDRFGVKVVSTTSFALLSGVLLCLGLLLQLPEALSVLLFAWAFIGYAGFTSYQARLAECYPENRGTAMAWNSTALYVGLTTGSILGGWVLDRYGFGILPFICSLAALVSVVLSLMVSKPKVGGLAQAD